MPAGNGYPSSLRWWRHFGRWIALALALVVIAYAHVRIGGLLIDQTNASDKNILGADQKQNIKLALLARQDLSPDFTKGVSEPLKDLFPHRTDGVVNPLWPWIAAWLADKDQAISPDDKVTEQDRAFFNRGRWFNVGFTLGIVAVLGIACLRVFSLTGTLSVVLLTGFGALLPRAAFFQPEPVYFALFLATWIACLFALHKNSLWMHALIGFFGGLAYLAKGSVQPLLMVYVAVSTLRWAWGWVEARRTSAEGSTTMWVRRNHWLALFLMGFCFFMTAGPRLSYSAKVFGSPFHSFPSYWMWFDDFKDCYAWMGEHNTREKLEAEPRDKLPSFKTYAATHTSGQMLQRLRDGTRDKVMELLWPKQTLVTKKGPKPWKGVLEWRGIYLGWLALMLVGLIFAMRFATPRPAHAAQRLHPETTAQILFVLGSIAGFSLAYGWYTPIGRGDRFMLSLYAPMVLCLVWACESLLRRARRRGAPEWLYRGYHLGQGVLIAAVSWRLLEILRFPQFQG
ncbi:MAG: hypothetical protein JWO94_1168 [Verrucomicrobiaceae bacterium]|nr:hypothetical protein [Verrucomicrobiaceae bacterium]